MPQKIIYALEIQVEPLFSEKQLIEAYKMMKTIPQHNIYNFM